MSLTVINISVWLPVLAAPKLGVLMLSLVLHCLWTVPSVFHKSISGPTKSPLSFHFYPHFLVSFRWVSVWISTNILANIQISEWIDQLTSRWTYDYHEYEYHEYEYHKVNRCLARYSPRHNHQPTHNRVLNKPAWPGPNWPKMSILGQIWSFWGKKS